MHSPTTSLAWELWRKNRLCILILSGLLPLGLLVRWLVLPMAADPAAAFCACAMLVTFLALFGIFSCTDSGVQISYPPRAFTLPVSTNLLAHGPILLGALVVSIFHLAWSYLLLLPLNPRYPVGAFTAFWIAALISFQAIIWCLSNYPTLLATALALLAGVLIGLTNVLVGEPGDPGPMICLGGMIAISYAAAWFGIARQRCGQWHIPPQLLPLVFKNAGGLLRSRRLFASPARAQLWIEWRRNAATPLLMAALGLAAFFAFLARLEDVGDFVPGGMSTAWLLFFSSALTFWAAMSGVLAARDASTNSLSLSPFLAVRPISSGELAWAKIKLAFGLTAIGWLLYALGVSLWIGALHGGHHVAAAIPVTPTQSSAALHGGQDRYHTALKVPAYRMMFAPDHGGHHRYAEEDEVQTIALVALGLAWHLIGCLPCWLAGRIPSPGVAGLVLIGGYIFLGNMVKYCCEHIGLMGAPLEQFLVVLFAAKILLAAWSFRQCLVRHLLGGRAIVTYIVIWTFATACFVAIAWKFAPEAHISQALAVCLAALLFPIARIGLAPLAVAAARHR
jgi:hypothetical protein